MGATLVWAALGILVSVAAVRADQSYVSAIEAADKTLVLFDPMEGPAKDAPAARELFGQQDLRFVPGKFGDCAYFAGQRACIRYPSSILPYQQGTIELWISFDEAPGQFTRQRNIFIWPIKAWHDNSIELLVGGSKDWGRHLLYKVCDENAKRFYIITSLASWKPGQWHQIAVTWRTGLPGKSFMALYIDQKLVQRLADQTILMDPDAIRHPPFPQGHWLWLHGGGTQAGFKIDEFKIYNTARDYN